MISGKHLYLSVKSAIRTLKGRRREPAAFLIAAVCFSGGFALGKLLADKWITRLQIAMYAVGAIAFVYGVVRVWKLVNPPELPPAKDRPSAIKGPMAFTEADGDLFRKLGRESELQKLLGFVLDNQIFMIVVRGASGAGKTSLLRAGLKHILRDRAVFHYWEAVPTKSERGLLRALQESWPEGVNKPTSLIELVNPSDALGRHSHLIVLDQFEQLRGNKQIFQLLQNIIRKSRPPHRITWVIAFRREFSDAWLDFISPEQEEKGFRAPQDVSLRLFTTEQAYEVIGQLINESNLKDSIEQSVINNLVEAATVNGEVSPVDIGIGLMVLSELRPRQSGQPITKSDYQFAGGAEGLLTQYITQRLELFPPESHESILKAMLALRDPEENRQRLATGLTIDKLAMEADTDPRVLKSQLNRLADRDIRLLEAETPTDGSAMRYRLPHERLIPALYRLTGKLLAEVDQAKLKFQNAFQAWHTNDKRSRYLLKGKELRLVQRYETQIPWGKDEQEKKGFLSRSKRRRQLVWAATVASGLVLIGIGWYSMVQYQHSENRTYLTESGYPAELYDFQHQLKKLEMTEPLDLEHFTWLTSNSIEELSLKAAESSNSIAGLSSLSRCRSLKKLTLDLSVGSSNLLKSRVTDLKPLAQLAELRELALNLSGSQVSNLQPLTQLNKLQQLTLILRDSEVSDLQPLAQVKGLQQLTLVLRGSQLSDLQSLAQLTGLQQLTLDLRGQLTDLQPLAQLTGLHQLTLDLRDSQVNDLQPLSQLKGLQLILSGGIFKMGTVKSLERLQGLTQLMLYLDSGFERIRLLKELRQLTPEDDSQATGLQPLAQLKRLQQLTLILNDEAYDLEPLTQLTGLTQLTLGLRSNQVRDLQFLAQLKGLKQLTLYLSNNQGSDLRLLAQLKELQQLTLVLRDSNARDLQFLAQLKGLQQLTLDLRYSPLNDLQPLAQLTSAKLTLSVSGSQVSYLQPLAEHPRLQLALSLNGSQLSYLESVRKQTSLQILSIENATLTERLSLRSIPASVVELKF